MGEAKVFDVGGEGMSQFTIRHVTIFLFAPCLMSLGDVPPGGEVNFIDGDR